MKLPLFARRDGNVTIETALVLPVFLGLVFGIINGALVLWTQGSLYYAAGAAARCASVNATTCGSADAVETYALTRYHGRSTGGSNPFTYAATGCGHTVTASYSYSLSIPFVSTYSLPLSATACFP